MPAKSEMETKSWQQIELLFHTVLDLDAGQREAYLSETCAGNSWLHGEIKSLIAAFESRPEFLAQPAFGSGSIKGESQFIVIAVQE